VTRYGNRGGPRFDKHKDQDPFEKCYRKGVLDRVPKPRERKEKESNLGEEIHLEGSYGPF